MLKFMRYKYLYFLISALVLIPGLFSLIRWGLKPSIDFTGGSLLEIEVGKEQKQKINKEILEEIARKEEIELASVQTSGENTYLLRAKPFDQVRNTSFQEKIASASGEATVSAVLVEKRFETVGPTLGAELLKKTLIALVVAAIFILAYVAHQFKDKKYGVCAILAVFHDTFVVLGVFSLLGHFYGVEIDTLFVTAVLTILSFSVHDTIVVYDRIRESIKNFPKAKFEDLVDKAVAETLSRSVNNSMTIIFMLLSLYLLGGETTKWFVLALLVGAVSGTYSSTFTAAPLLVVWENWKKAKKKSFK